MNNLTRLSQNQLNLLETCPRKFQHLYLDQLKFPLSREQQEHITWGNRFHLLMQQRELGLPIESLLNEDPQLEHSLNALVRAAPETLTPASETWREAEHCRTLNFQGYLLTVVYDLLLADAQKADIFDWKTYLQPTNRNQLANDWQTRLYLYVLAETSPYLPEQIAMTYWFVKQRSAPTSLTLTYDNAQHEKTQQDLTTLLTKLDRWLPEYREQGKPFPQVAEEKGLCPSCSFAVRCQRTPESSELVTGKDWCSSVAEIEEVPLSNL